MTTKEIAQEVLIRLQRNSVEARQIGIIRKAIEDAEARGAIGMRDRCAKICEGHAKDHRSSPEESPVQYAASEAETLAAAIRRLDP